MLELCDVKIQFFLHTQDYIPKRSIFVLFFNLFCSPIREKITSKTMKYSVGQLVKHLIHPPKTEHIDFFEEARYILAYRMNLFLMISLGFLSVVLYTFYGPVHSVMTFIGFICVFISLILIRKTKKHRLFTVLVNLMGGSFCILTLYVIDNQPHVIDGLWMTINILFAFLALGKYWGIALSLVHACVLSTFYVFNFSGQLEIMQKMTNEQLIGLGVNTIICFLIIMYLSWQNIMTNKFASSQLSEAKEKLQGQFDVITKQNDEKTVMLKEIHHRVKNNLQVITSLLRLQSRELQNEEAISKFKDTINRVMAMSMIHEKMYQSEQLSKIDIKDYFESLANDLLGSYRTHEHIDVQIECDVNSIGMRPIVPLALIFNELFSNSIKHAFTEITTPTIEIKLIRDPDRSFVFIYSDYGNWIETEKSNAFGLDLIRTLTEQLDGTMSIQKEVKTQFFFRFKNLDK